MGVDKVLDFLRRFWVAHSPTVVVAFVVLLAVNFYALPPGRLLDLGESWKGVKEAIDSTLNEMGIKIERGYVVFSLLYVGLVAVEWVSSLLMKLPGLPLYTSFRISSRHTAEQAGRILGAGSSFYEIGDRLSDLLEKYRRSFADRKERSPYEWLADRAMLWSRYYGLALLVAVVLLAWWAFGASGAGESRKVIHLALATTAFAAVARWRNLALRYRKDDWESGAALRTYEAEQPRRHGSFERGDARGKAFGSFCEYRRACRDHPAEIIRRLTVRLPMSPLNKFFVKRLNHPQYWEPSDWRLFASAEMRCTDEDPIEFSALRTKDFEDRFASLLECRGSGLFMVAHRDLGLAPATFSGGEAYCIGSRNHDGTSLQLRFTRSYGNQGIGTLHVHSKPNRDAYLIDLGPFPIERVAQFESPPEMKFPNYRTKLKNVKEDLCKWAKSSGSKLDVTAAAYPGHSYLWLSEFSDTADVIVGFQCFAVEGRQGCLLVLYRILAVIGAESLAPPVLPWWRPGAWAKLLKPSPSAQK